MEISILTIGTGKYIDFIPGLIKSAEKNFFKNHKKTYYVFTDTQSDIKIGDAKIVKIYQAKLGWPYDTMMRFHMFLCIEKDLKKSDFTFFLNANLEFRGEVGNEILPNMVDEFFTGVSHPGYFKLDTDNMPYERRKESNFYIDDSDNKNKNYYQGCLNGGDSKKFIEMSQILASKIDKDIKSNIIPVWHDESAINWYFRNIKIKTLEPEYALPEQILDGDFVSVKIDSSQNHCYDFLIGVKPYIIQRDKRKYGGTNFLRNNF
jgi:hypothetical protein